MATKQNEKVGSDPKAAEHVGGENDFGVSADNTGAARAYVSNETKSRDPGGGIRRSHDNLRTSGAGGNDSGRGSSSGGDVDTGNDALVGVGDPHQHPPKEEPTASKDRGDFKPVVAADPTRAGARDNDSSSTAADVNNETAHGNNAFKGDITSDEATGAGGV